MPKKLARLERLIPLSCLLFACSLLADPAQAGDSLYGTVVNVKSPEVITFESGPETVDVRLLGIEAPLEKRRRQDAVAFLQNLLLDKKARIRTEYRTPDGELLGRLYTDDAVLGIKEVAVELLRLGLVVRQEGVDFKYGELAAAEDEARKAGRGVWSTSTK